MNGDRVTCRRIACVYTPVPPAAEDCPQPIEAERTHDPATAKHHAMRLTFGRHGQAPLMLLALTALGGCASAPPERAPARRPAEVRAQIVQLCRPGWPTHRLGHGHLRRVRRADIPPSTSNLCATLAVTAQESTYTISPVVPGLARIARAEIDRRAAQHHVPRLLVDAALLLKSPTANAMASASTRCAPSAT